MNILFFSFAPMLAERGGVQRVSETLADIFEARGHKCWYLARPHEVQADVREFSRRQLFLPARKFRGNARKMNDAFFRKLLEEKDIDIIFWQDAEERAFPFRRVLETCGRKIILLSVVHDMPDHWMTKFAGMKGWRAAFRKWRHKKRIECVYRFNYEISDRTVLLSERFKAEFRRYFPKTFSGEKLAAIGNPMSGMNAEALMGEKKKELLFVGRMAFSQKRPDHLLRIWAKLEKRFPAWSLRVVGDGDYLPALKELAGTLGLERVHFEGFQKPEPYYRDASILCMTSAYEGFGLVLVEAASFGCVPAAFDSFAAVRDIIADGENGCLVPAFDLDAYAETLARLMSDDALRERLAKNALAQIPEKFSPEKIGAQWERLFAEAFHQLFRRGKRNSGGSPAQRKDSA